MIGPQRAGLRAMQMLPAGHTYRKRGYATLSAAPRKTGPSAPPKQDLRQPETVRATRTRGKRAPTPDRCKPKTATQ
jgi:hypothetical protein